MANGSKPSVPTSFGLLAARLPLGALFAMKGYEKFQGRGVTEFVSKHVDLVPRYMPPWFATVYLTGLPFAEMALGACLVAGFLSRVGGFLTSCLLVSFLIVYGVHDPHHVWPFNPDFFFLGTSVLLLFAGGGGYGVDGRLFGGKGTGGSAAKHV
jgi:uncharacterized membrane protein YphA (DoxX/SURF4 family)